MKFSKSFELALSSILNNKMRSFLTMLGIIIGVGSVIILVSIMSGVTGQVTDMFEKLGTNTIQVMLFSRGDTRTVEPDDMYHLADSNPELFSYISPNISVDKANVRPKDDPDSISTSVSGVSEQYDKLSGLDMKEGRFLQYIDVDKMRKVCVIGTYIEKELFANKNALGETIKINGVPYTVVGVLEELADSSQGSGDEAIYIPYTNAGKLSENARVNSYTVAAKDENAVDAAIAKIEEMLYKVFGSEDFYTVIGMKQMLDQMNTITGTMTAALVCIAGISLLVGGIGIMNIMLVSVTERTKEIGIRKSLGAKRKHIMRQFVIEAGKVSGLGGIIGIAFGAAVAMLAGKLLGISVSPSPNAIGLAFGVSVAIGLIFGFLPANKAAKLNPIDALRFE